jgi:hypothetical protein
MMPPTRVCPVRARHLSCPNSRPPAICPGCKASATRPATAARPSFIDTQSAGTICGTVCTIIRDACPTLRGSHVLLGVVHRTIFRHLHPHVMGRTVGCLDRDSTSRGSAVHRQRSGVVGLSRWDRPVADPWPSPGARRHVRMHRHYRVPGRWAPKPRRFEHWQAIAGRLAQSRRQTRTADPCSKIVG